MEGVLLYNKFCCTKADVHLMADWQNSDQKFSFCLRDLIVILHLMIHFQMCCEEFCSDIFTTCLVSKMPHLRD